MKWSISNRIEASEPTARIQEILTALLNDRGVTSEASRNLFLHPTDPLKIPASQVGIDSTSLTMTVERIKTAIAHQESILIYGDYDADGITATATLWETIYGLGGKAIPFIPHRERHGYGLSIAGLTEAIAAYSPTLIITVDNGIVAHEAALYVAAQEDIDLIITDHHQKGTTIPPCYSLVHTDMIAGSGVAWFLSKELSPEWAAKTLELVTIGTVADMLPLSGPNRSIVTFGLAALRTSTRPGLMALLSNAGIEKDTSIDTYHINFVIAPRLNAMGRLDDAVDSLRLLCTTNSERAKELAELLGTTNKTRQDLTLEFITKGESLVSDTTKHVLIVDDSSFHEGVIGLVAGKLAEKYYRPTIVISRREGISKASARSIRGVNIIEMIRLFNHLLVNAGGHPMAAGFTIETNNIEQFKEALEKYAQDTITTDLLDPTLTIDAQIELSDISPDLYAEIELLRPFGIANPRPVFSVLAATILDAQQIGKEKTHLKLRFMDGNRFITAIGFGMGYRFEDLGKTADIAFTIQENEWNGRKNLQLLLKDFR